MDNPYFTELASGEHEGQNCAFCAKFVRLSGKQCCDLTKSPILSVAPACSHFDLAEIYSHMRKEQH